MIACMRTWHSENKVRSNCLMQQEAVGGSKPLSLGPPYYTYKPQPSPPLPHAGVGMISAGPGEGWIPHSHTPITRSRWVGADHNRKA